MVLAAHPQTVQLVFRHFPIEFARPLAFNDANRLSRQQIIGAVG
jgi:hypothetical protein